MVRINEPVALCNLQRALCGAAFRYLQLIEQHGKRNKILTPNRLYLFIVAAFLLCSCAQTKQYTPSITAKHYELQGLPSDIVRVEVKDLRPDHSGDGLAEILRGEVLKALSPIPSDQQDRFIIKIDVVEHRAFFTLGNWNATTRFRIRLVDSSGDSIGDWNVVGSASRSNMWGYTTAKLVSQDSYNIAIADMMSLLSSVSLRK